MGYARRICAEALKQSNNRVEQATEMLLNQKEMLKLSSQSSASPDEDNQYIELPLAVEPDSNLMAELISLGAEPDVAQALLIIHGNQLEKAAEELLQKSLHPSKTCSSTPSTVELLERAKRIEQKRGKGSG
jgi:hypothetical protein